MTRILGIDPGKTGAIAFIDSEQPNNVMIEDMPLVANEINPYTLASLIADYKPNNAMIELVASMPKQGVRSVFSFGVSYGQVRGIGVVVAFVLKTMVPLLVALHV